MATSLRVNCVLTVFVCSVSLRGVTTSATVRVVTVRVVSYQQREEIHLGLGAMI